MTIFATKIRFFALFTKILFFVAKIDIFEDFLTFLPKTFLVGIFWAGHSTLWICVWGLESARARPALWPPGLITFWRPICSRHGQGWIYSPHYPKAIFWTHYPRKFQKSSFLPKITIFMHFLLKNDNFLCNFELMTPILILRNRNTVITISTHHYLAGPIKLGRHEGKPGPAVAGLSQAWTRPCTPLVRIYVPICTV
jgi:hypothetical protein